MKIKEEELNTILSQQSKLDGIVKEIGIIETQKHALCHEVGMLNQEIQKTKVELEQAYGSININMADGSYEDIEKEKTPELTVVEDV
tara:strand:- start:1488 stop:1748 length:261 start_codon:yes stop_codon:yes gene_type:complete